MQKLSSNANVIAIGAVAAIVSITAILIFRPETSLLEMGSLITFLTMITGSVLSYMESKDAKIEAKEARDEARQAKEQSIETHLSVNSKLDQFIKNAGLVQRAIGYEEGVAAANLRTDELAKQTLDKVSKTVTLIKKDTGELRKDSEEKKANS